MAVTYSCPSINDCKFTWFKAFKRESPNLLLIRKWPEVLKSRTLNPVSSEPPGPRAQAPQKALGTRVLGDIENGSSHIRQFFSTPYRNVNRYSKRCRRKLKGERTGTHLVRKSEDWDSAPSPLGQQLQYDVVRCSMCVNDSFQSLMAVAVHTIIGTLRSEDGDGRENVAEKVNSRSFNLHRGYSKSLTLSNVGEPS